MRDRDAGIPDADLKLGDIMPITKKEERSKRALQTMIEESS
jgi:hypothetical protein